jgi:putative MATE family efflux protein
VPDGQRTRVDMTTGAITPKLAELAWPLVAGNLLQTLYNVVDMFWVGRVSPEAVAAVALMFPLSWMFVSTAMGITAATIALVSQYVGADADRRADRVVGQTVLLTLAVSAVLATVGWLFRHDLLELIGAEGQVFVDSLAYIEVIFLALPLTFLFFAFRAALQGAGDTKTAMWLVIVSVAVNVVLDPVLILGWGPFSAMGTRGAGWATFVARAVATVTGVAILLRGGYGVRLHVRDLRPHPTVLGRLLAIGWPATADGWARSFSAVVMAAFVAPFGTAAIAAYGVGVRLMSVSWSVAGAVGQAVATGVGQNLGAETPDRADTLTWRAVGGTMAILFAAAALCVAIPEVIVGIFVADPAVIAEGRIFLWIVAPFWAFFGATMVLQGAFRGAGQTKVAMTLSVLSRWVFRVPIAILLAFSVTVAIPFTDVVVPEFGFGIGVVGVWAAFSIGSTLACLVAALWFRRGGWQDAVIDTDPGGPEVGEPPDLDAGD